MRRCVFGLAMLIAAAGASTAAASQVISPGAVQGIELGVNGKGEAMVTYTSRGKVVHVLAWGGENAVVPKAGGRQAELQLAYDGGYAKYYTRSPVRQETHSAAGLAQLRASAKSYYKTFACPAYDGPRLAFAVGACKAPDGSYWAVQSWPRRLPDYGVAASTSQAALEVHLSHWTGPLPVLAAASGRSGREHGLNRLWGTLTYGGQPVFGFKATSSGQPLDAFGRNVYIDTYASAYGSGWRRENSVLVHNPTGSFCYSLGAHGSRPAGTGTSYRLTVIGPGATPDVTITVPAPAPFDAKAQAEADAEITALGDAQCRP